jgi:phosphatidylglycerol:prolipoprotein diacylglycerol transferase
MLPTISIGPLTFPTAGLVYILGIWIALTVVEKAAARLTADVDTTYTLATVALATAFITARLAFVAGHWSAYSQNLIGIVWPLTGGFNLWAGVGAGAAAGFFYGRAKNLSPGATLDALAPGILVGLMTVSLADFLAGPGFGTEADLPWSITLFGIERHPVQLYELLVAAVALLAWNALRTRPRPEGRLFLVAAGIYGAGRLFTDAFRANAWLTAGGYHVLQIISLAVLLTCLLLLMRLAPHQPPEGRPDRQST